MMDTGTDLVSRLWLGLVMRVEDGCNPYDVKKEVQELSSGYSLN